MGDQAQALACSRCGRRFAAPEILEGGKCPSCGGELVPLEESPHRDPPLPPKR